MPGNGEPAFPPLLDSSDGVEHLKHCTLQQRRTSPLTAVLQTALN